MYKNKNNDHTAFGIVLNHFDMRIDDRDVYAINCFLLSFHAWIETDPEDDYGDIVKVVFCQADKLGRANRHVSQDGDAIVYDLQESRLKHVDRSVFLTDYELYDMPD
jgi:hypothetical protein